jgi:hypothetical protein
MDIMKIPLQIAALLAILRVPSVREVAILNVPTVPLATTSNLLPIQLLA